MNIISRCVDRHPREPLLLYLIDVIANQKLPQLCIICLVCRWTYLNPGQTTAAIKIGESQIDFIMAPEPGTPIQHTFEWRTAKPGKYLIHAQAVDSSGKRLSPRWKRNVFASNTLSNARATPSFNTGPSVASFSVSAFPLTGSVRRSCGSKNARKW